MSNIYLVPIIIQFRNFPLFKRLFGMYQYESLKIGTKSVENRNFQRDGEMI